MIVRGLEYVKVKTNAMRILDSNKIEYKILSYETKKGEHIDGVEVAHQIGRDVSEVYKNFSSSRF